jgi:hypothetical protein
MKCKEWLLDPESHIEDTEDSKLHTALLWCCRRGAAKCLELLLEAGANIEATLPGSNASGMYLATQEDQSKCVEILLDAKADPNRKLAGQGVTALSMGAMMGRKDCVRLLISGGADVNLLAADGTSVLYSARNNHCDGDSPDDDDAVESILQMLIDAGARDTEETLRAAEEADRAGLEEVSGTPDRSLPTNCPFVYVCVGGRRVAARVCGARDSLHSLCSTGEYTWWGYWGQCGSEGIQWANKEACKGDQSKEKGPERLPRKKSKGSRTLLVLLLIHSVQCAGDEKVGARI